MTNGFWNENFADLGDVRIRYSTHGHGEIPVILLHGLACGQRMWYPVVASLMRDFQVLTYDARGHGGTTFTPLSRPLDVADYVNDLERLLEYLEIERCHIVGFSFGAGAAMGLAARRPEMVRSLVLADIGADSRGLVPA